MIVGISGKMQSGKDTVALICQYLYDYHGNQYTHPITERDFNEYVKNNHHLKCNWKNVKFADKLKDMICLLLGCTMEQLEDPIFKETPLGEEWVKYELSYVSHDRLSYCSCSKYYKKYFCSKEEAIEYIEGDLEVDQDSIEISKIELTPRLLLQLLGTECGRDIIHPNIWVNATFADYQPNGAPYNSLGDVFDDLKLCPSETKMPNWIISDVRFPNEAKAIKDRNGILIRVERFCYDSAEDFLVCNPDPELRKIGIHDYNINKTLSLKEITDIAKAHGYVPLSKQHESEIALDNYNDWDYVIDNNGTIEDLIEKVKEILIIEELLKK